MQLLEWAGWEEGVSFSKKWLYKKRGGHLLTPLGEALFPKPQKRPTDVPRNLTLALNSRKNEHVALGEEERL